jgi:hypothetical protein
MSSDAAHRRCLADNLESDLWLWREERLRDDDGKNNIISKRLVQARAKCAFQKNGMTEFRVRRKERKEEGTATKVS